MLLVQDFMQGTHQVMLVDQVKPLTSHHDRNRPHAQIVMQLVRIVLELLTHASSTNPNLCLSDRELRG